MKKLSSNAILTTIAIALPSVIAIIFIFLFINGRNELKAATGKLAPFQQLAGDIKQFRVANGIMPEENKDLGATESFFGGSLNIPNTDFNRELLNLSFKSYATTKELITYDQKDREATNRLKAMKETPIVKKK